MESERKKVSPLVIGFVVVQAIVLIIAIVLWNIFRSDNTIDSDDVAEQPQVVIEGLAGSMDWLTEIGIDDMQRSVFAAVQRNNNNVEMRSVGAVVREGTMRAVYFDDLGANYLTAVVDLPELQQSYRIFYEDLGAELDPDSSVIVLCLDEKAEMIYPDFDCRDATVGTRSRIVQSFLPYYDFGEAEVEMDKDSGEIVALVYDAAEGDKVMEEIRRAVEELGMSPELFTYRVVTPENIIDSLEDGEIYGG